MIRWDATDSTDAQSLRVRLMTGWIGSVDSDPSNRGILGLAKEQIPPGASPWDYPRCSRLRHERSESHLRR